MGTAKQINTIGRTYYFYSDIIDLDHSDDTSLKIDKKSYKDLDFYNIGHVIKQILDVVMMLIV